jgi:hypothetical protein
MCLREINALMEELGNQYSGQVMVAALLEHLRGSLFLSLDNELISESTARDIIRRLKDAAGH